MHLDDHYTDPRLVALYDIENNLGADGEFYLRLASEQDVERIIDLGCGTGTLACALATMGKNVTGVDPSPAMLACTQGKQGAENVRWVEGTSSALGELAADLVIMTGNVAQVFLDDDEWASNLADVYRSLRPGGRLAFESRNPEDRGWLRWTPEKTFETHETPFGPVECWLEVTDVDERTVRIVGHNRFLATGETIIAASELRFRTLAELSESLEHAGFAVEAVHGDWNHGPLTSESRAMIFIARRPGPSHG